MRLFEGAMRRITGALDAIRVHSPVVGAEMQGGG